MTKKHLVILGGGFGGLHTALQLEKCFCSDLLEVTLISKENYFLFTPMIHEVATGGLDKNNVVVPIRELLSSKTNFLMAEANEINLSSKVVKTNVMDVNYDYLVLATGAVTNYYNIPGAEEYTLPLKNIKDALKIKTKVIESFEAALSTTDTKAKKELLTFTIVGGGPTGLELTAELVELIRENAGNNFPSLSLSDVEINLVCGPCIIPYFDKSSQEKSAAYLESLDVSLLMENVAEVGKNYVKLTSGKTITSNNIFWTAGVKPNLPKITPDLELDKSGRLTINEFLQIPTHPEIFAIGDVASGWPMLAYTASEQATHLAKNLSNLLNQKPLKPFLFKPAVKLMSLGQKNAVGEFFGLKLSGRLLWFVWRTVYLIRIPSFKKKVKIALNWTFNIFTNRDISKTS